MKTRNLYTKNILFAKNPTQAKKFFSNWVRSENQRGVVPVNVSKSKDGYSVDFIRKRK
jgi:hypothetical protein